MLVGSAEKAAEDLNFSHGVEKSSVWEVNSCNGNDPSG